MPAPPGLPFLVSGESRRDVGQFADVLAEAGSHILFVERWNPTDVTFSPDDHAGLVILGDSRHWATSRKYQRDRDWLAAALAAGRPVLGICFGAQLLAAHLAGITNGRSLSINPNRDHVGKLIGVEVRGMGLEDPVISHLAKGAPVPQWHEDSFQLPPGAIGLAWSKELVSAHCEAFRVGDPEDAVYGAQFHPEPTAEMLRFDGWFTRPENTDDINSAVAAGRRLLVAWATLAVAREHGGPAAARAFSSSRSTNQQPRT